MDSVFLDGQGHLRNGWKVLGYFVLTIAFGILVGLTTHFLPATRRVLNTPWTEFLVFLAAAWVCLRIERGSLASLGFRLDGRWARELALGTLGGFGLMAVTAAVVFLLGGFHWTRTPGVGAAALLKGAWFYLAVAFAEETGFRGYPFQRALRGLGVSGAQILFALCFSLAHWHNPGMSGATRIWATVNIGLAAILLGLCYLRTGSLALAIGVHLGWNWTQGTLFGFGVSGLAEAGWWTPIFHGRPTWLTGGAFGLEASLPCVLVCGTAVLLLARWKGTVPRDPGALAA